jgi:hypothetical protein
MVFTEFHAVFKNDTYFQFQNYEENENGDWLRLIKKTARTKLLLFFICYPLKECQYYSSKCLPHLFIFQMLGGGRVLAEKLDRQI